MSRTIVRRAMQAGEGEEQGHHDRQSMVKPYENTHDVTPIAAAFWTEVKSGELRPRTTAFGPEGEDARAPGRRGEGRCSTPSTCRRRSACATTFWRSSGHDLTHGLASLAERFFVPRSPIDHQPLSTDRVGATRPQDRKVTVNSSKAAVAEAIGEAKSIGANGGSPLGQRQDPELLRTTAVSTEVAFRTFKKLLDAHGLRYALYSLLRLTDYRFLTVFRAEHGMTSSLAHVDREDISVTATPAAPEIDTYCCYVRSNEGPFVLVDSTVDARVGGHPKQSVLRAYCGVPIVSVDGELLGTLCHYDSVPRDPAQLDTELLVQVASEIARSGSLC